ncbi:DcaP family trimeric outer membrane transporter [Rhodoligotrophos ferricapiens]|uniref:DcaP family trimeric outer membrane transporter n=1 Tax=Rhodoligotrophos ferricapiens TaxID=3069264 RepID=UPI00315D162F
MKTVQRIVSLSLLAGVAMAGLTSHAKADELVALKAQLEALQAQVDQLQSRPASAPLPEGASWITFRRGTEATADWNMGLVGDAMPTTSGMTIAITPSADLPAPIHEVTISGYVKGDVIYDFDQDLGDFFSYTAIDGQEDQDHVRLHARQSRFSIKSKSDTAIGQIRTLIEGDFLSGGSFGGTDFRLRHAWGEWDMTPNWTFGAGQTTRNFASPFTGITTVDNNGPLGLIGSTRAPQVRLTWHEGPQLFAVAIENPSDGQLINSFGQSSSNIPNFTARWQYETEAGHQFLISGLAANYHLDGDLDGPYGSDSKFGWGVQAAANVVFTDFLTLTTSVMYGDGIGQYLFGATGAYVDAFGDIKTIEALGVFAGLIFDVTDTTQFNVGWGWSDMDRNDVLDTGLNDENVEMMSLHANILWRPVDQLRLGWEVMWGQRERTAGIDPAIPGSGGTVTDDAWRAQFGAWFYF